MKRILLLAIITSGTALISGAFGQEKAKAEETEYYTPVPPVVTPGASFSDAPSDAIVLFDGRNLDQWVSTKDSTPAKWTVADNAFTVNKAAGDIQTRSTFSDYQL